MDRNGDVVLAREHRAVELGALEQTVAFHLSIAYSLALETFLESLEDRPRNPRYVMLTLIRINPGITQAELSGTHYRDKSSMSPIINDFLAARLVEKTPVKLNGRPAQGLSLTQAGQDECRRLQPFADSHSARIVSVLGPGDQAELIRLLRSLADGLSVDKR